MPRLTPIALAALGLLMYGCGPKAATPHGLPPAKVSVVTVHPETVPVTRQYIGRGEASYDVELRSLVSGRVKERVMVDGAEVKAGDVLFTLDDTPFKAALENARAKAAQCEATLKNARRTAGRIRAIPDARAVSDKDRDDAASAMTMAEAQFEAARSAVVNASWELENTRIVAPVSGHLDKSRVEAGATVTAHLDALVRIRQTDPFRVRFSIPESVQLRFQKDVREGRITSGADADIRVALTLGDGSAHPTPGRIDFSDINFNANVSAMEARATFDNPDKTLRPGQFFTVTLSGPKKQGVFLVPQRAVQIDPTGKHVFVIAKMKDKEGAEYVGVKVREVVTGEWVEGRWVVESGLDDGDRVLVEGSTGVGMRGGEGAAVIPEEYAPASGDGK